MVEKTVEELQLELDNLKKQSLENEIEAERVKLAQVEELKKKEAENKLKSEVREQVIAELSNKSNISSGVKTEPLKGNSVVEQFKTDYVAYANNDLSMAKIRGDASRSELNVFKARTYEELLKDLKNGIKRRG